MLICVDIPTLSGLAETRLAIQNTTRRNQFASIFMKRMDNESSDEDLSINNRAILASEYWVVRSNPGEYQCALNKEDETMFTETAGRCEP